MGRSGYRNHTYFFYLALLQLWNQFCCPWQKKEDDGACNNVTHLPSDLGFRNFTWHQRQEQQDLVFSLFHSDPHQIKCLMTVCVKIPRKPYIHYMYMMMYDVRACMFGRQNSIQQGNYCLIFSKNENPSYLKVLQHCSLNVLYCVTCNGYANFRVKGPWHAFSKILREGGVRGLWKGWVPNVQRAALVNMGG
jgi:hypothetical protein